MADPDFRPTRSGELLVAVADGVGHLRLNRPRAINALTSALIADARAQLAAWADDDAVESVVLDGAGEKGFCAGGDVRACREMILAGHADDAATFWRDEYALVSDVKHYAKPVKALQKGIVMGGGLGLSSAASDRVVDAGASLAMPETQIGFSPDAGANWFFARAGNLGRHLALTGSSMNAADALAVGFSDRCDGVVPEPLWHGQDWLECYAEADPVAVVAALEAHGASEAREAATVLRQKSPLMVWVAWEGLKHAANEDWAAVIAEDIRIADIAMHRPDFAEGVRAQLVDKDRNPRWTHARLEDVGPADVAEFFGG